MNWPDEVKPLIEKYSRGYAWICMNEKDPAKKEDYEKVNQKLMALEDELRSKGVTNEQIGEVISKVNKMLDKKTGEMSSRELEFVCQIIFGRETKLEEGKKLRDSDMIFANGKLGTYAYHKREGNMD